MSTSKVMVVVGWLGGTSMLVAGTRGITSGIQHDVRVITSFPYHNTYIAYHSHIDS